MAEHSNISWTDATWNVITGCSVVSPGCTNCYAMKLAGGRLKHHPSRVGLTRPSKAGPVWTGMTRWNEEWFVLPLAWTRKRMIFVCAHGDLFHETVHNAWIDKVMAMMLVAYLTRDEGNRHAFQVLTKRAKRMHRYMNDPATPERVRKAVDAVKAAAPNLLLPRSFDMLWPIPNVWMGVSAEDMDRAEERVPLLMDTPAEIRWVSAEPLLGRIEFRLLKPLPEKGPLETIDALTGKAYYAGSANAVHRYLKRIDWIVAGGESGDRPMALEWAREIQDDCAAAGVAYYTKQLGSKPTLKGQPFPISGKGDTLDEWPTDLRVQQMPVGGMR